MSCGSGSVIWDCLFFQVFFLLYLAPWGWASVPSQAAGSPKRCPGSAQICSSSHLLRDFPAQSRSSGLPPSPRPPLYPPCGGATEPWLLVPSLHSFCCCLAFRPGVLFISFPSGSQQPLGPRRHYCLCFAVLSQEAGRM